MPSPWFSYIIGIQPRGSDATALHLPVRKSMLEGYHDDVFAGFMYVGTKAALLFAMAHLGPLAEPLKLLDGRLMPRIGLGVYRPEDVSRWFENTKPIVIEFFRLDGFHPSRLHCL